MSGALKGTPGEARAAGRLIHDGEVTVVVRCKFIGCPWSIEIGTAPLEAHSAYLDHLDVHDIETLECGCPTSGIQSHGCTAPDLHRPEFDDCDQEDGPEHNGHETEAEALDCPICRPQLGGLYAGDTAEQIAAEQSRIDRFMAGGED